MQVKRIEDKCSNIAYDERQDLKESEANRNENCPRCHARKKDIVDQSSLVHGKGKVGGNLFLVSGSMKINTDMVNHCNKCNHEWEKFKMRDVNRTDILRVALRYLCSIIKDPKEKKHKWKLEAIKVFDESSAEAIHSLYRKHRSDMYSNRFVELRKLRRYYPSIYDGENKKELEKI